MFDGFVNVPRATFSGRFSVDHEWPLFGDHPGEGYACVEEVPLRCWKVPGDATLIDSRIESGSPTIVSMLLYAKDGVHNKFTVVRTAGAGDATPP